MAKFNELPEADRIAFLKDEFIKSIEELLIEPAEVKKLLSEDNFKSVMAYLPSIKATECDCGTCLNMDKLEARIPSELECLIDVARKRCEAKAY